MKLEELKDVYKKNWNLDLISNREETIYNIILKEADDLLTENNDDLILENKIVLSIAIRLLAEEYMISKITNQPQIEAISEFQTRLLFNEFKKEYQNDDNFETIMKNLEQVNIMTPENIHLNSFMYEPILDTPDHHLRELYENIVEANNAGNTT
jgi:hypothetical protein